MYRKISLLFIAFLTFSGVISAQQSSVTAFPGAEGFGANTPGGRGGKIYVVTNLNDNGPGSFREACLAKGPRIVVFNVSGIIDLKTPLNVTEPYITIAGQTAPGDGICLRRSEFEIQTHDAIVRFIRCRPGNISGEAMDAMGVGKNAHDVIVDHCSANWSIDECLSPSGAIANITIQWCLIGEALNKSVHPKGEHGYGSLVRAIGGVTLHHNLWLDNISRNPRLGDNYGKAPWPTFDFRNNVIYNWGGTCSGLTGDHLSANYVNNYLRPGPDSNNRPPIVLSPTADVVYFVEGNIVEGKPALSKNPLAMFTPTEENGKRLVTISNKPFDVAPVKTSSAKQAYTDVVALTGAICPVRDAIDSRLIDEVKNNKGKIINSQDEVSGWPVYRTVQLNKDSDGDGIPDSWETSHGLNANDPKDASIINNDGYSNIENYINGIALTQIEKLSK
ncbi:MAG: pectate lyase [Bacteroidota bacterium]|nr:pectate lyase [Bacteroidota bacterium]